MNRIIGNGATTAANGLGLADVPALALPLFGKIFKSPVKNKSTMIVHQPVYRQTHVIGIIEC
jgi:hypothetical protein